MTSKIILQECKKRLPRILLIVSSVIGISFGMYYYINDTPHCHMEGFGSYTCDILATPHQQQQICSYDTQMGIVMEGGKVTPDWAKAIWDWCDPAK